MYDTIAVQDPAEDDDETNTSFSERTDGNGSLDEELDREDNHGMIED